jgi:hypothetical protein
MLKAGKGGKVIELTQLDDDLKDLYPGSLCLALLQKGPRIVKFKVAGPIVLQDALMVREHSQAEVGGWPDLGK